MQIDVNRLIWKRLPAWVHDVIWFFGFVLVAEFHKGLPIAYHWETRRTYLRKSRELTEEARTIR